MMASSFSLTRLLQLAVLAATVMTPLASHAQGDDPLQRINADMTIIRAQLEGALRYDRMALQLLVENGTSPEAVEQARRVAREAYILARFAVGGLALKLEGQRTFKRFQDPLLEMLHQKVVDAWNGTRGIMEQGTLEMQIQRGQFAVERLEEALLLI